MEKNEKQHDVKGSNRFKVFGHALGRRARSMSCRFDFAVAEAMRRKLLDGWMIVDPAAPPHLRHRDEFGARPEF